MIKRASYLFLLLICFPIGSFAQRKTIEILGADKLTSDPSIVNAQRLLGNVRLKYNDAYMHCDSAYIYPNQDAEAFSKVRIVQGDSINLRSDRLFFSNTNKVAQLRDHIVLKDKDMTLTTEQLDYNMETGIASYRTGGKITSKTNQNTLTSKIGHYDSSKEFFHFQKNVKLVNPEYQIASDTLKYIAVSGVAWFFGPTTIKSATTEIYCENGWYNTTTDKCQFNENARILSGSTVMKGDSIVYNGRTGFGEIFCNVYINDTTSQYTITGDYGWHNEGSGESMVTERAMMIQSFENDSLFLHADTLKAYNDSIKGQVIRAYRDVRFYKSDMQGRADSLTYADKDSLLTLYYNPIIWSDLSQISGDTMRLLMANGQLERLFVSNSAFIVSQVADSAFNQIKGRHLTGYFRSNALYKIRVEGNGQTIYYPSEEVGGTPRVLGVNKADCSDLEIRINNNRIEKISLQNRPSGALHPLSRSTADDRFLEGFKWLIDSRPLSVADLLTPATAK
jgi:lipopolysaccharide export system protein LptA